MPDIGSLFGVSKKAVNLIVAALIAIVVFLALRSLWLKFVRRNAGKATVNSANLVIGRNYDNIAKQCHDAFDSFLATDSQSVCAQLNALNDDEIGQVNNRYIVLYGRGTKTLQDAVDGAFWGDPFADSPCGLLLGRLQALNIN